MLAVLVPTRSKGVVTNANGVHIVSPDKLNEIISKFASSSGGSDPSPKSFLDFNAYHPLPSLVEAARELFHSKSIREVWTSLASTDPAVNTVLDVVRKDAASKTRHLVLITGIPGSGKTLVGMRAVHSETLDSLSVAREPKKPTVPGLYLTENEPYSEVLQYQLRKDGVGSIPYYVACGYLSSSTITEFSCGDFGIVGNSVIPNFVLNTYGFIIGIIGVWLDMGNPVKRVFQLHLVHQVLGLPLRHFQYQWDFLRKTLLRHGLRPIYQIGD